MKLRPPALPLITHDPYFSVWSAESPLRNTVHWTGKPNTLIGRVYIDGEEYHFLGLNKFWEKGDAPMMKLDFYDVDAFSTMLVYSAVGIRLTVKFTSPVLPDDLYYASRPLTYCKVSYEPTDGKEHDVKVFFAVSEELVLNKRGESRVISNYVKIDGLTTLKMENGKQNVLSRAGDDVRIDWGAFYLSLVGEGECLTRMLDGMYAISIEASLDDERLFLFAYDDVQSIQYFGDNLEAYWKSTGKTVEEVIREAAEEYDTLLSRCSAFSEKLRCDAARCGGEHYSELLLLALRQVMAAHKLVLDKNGEVLYISKECSSNGCAATVDVTYPSAPMYLLYNVELLKGMLRPIMRYAQSDEWCFDFAPHDVGTYPLLNGQSYFVKRSGGSVEIDPIGQMPVEECGNMIILFAAICDADGNADFVKPYIDTVRAWSEYLIKYGEDPEWQNCTDDFAGHLAHNVNLAIKAVMGIAAYARILRHLGDLDGFETMMNIAENYARSIETRARNEDGSYRLTFDRPGTFSLKYNAVWDKIFKTELFSDEFYRGEIARYRKEMLYYGTPLDSREKYTKSDWLVWAASLSEDKADFVYLTDALWSAYNTMRTYVPMTDWYWCDTSHMQMFKNRTVLGGLFIKLLM